MESKNYKIIENFINDSEVDEIINWTKTLTHLEKNSNFHLTEISKSLNGNSFIFDISDNKITNYITDFQSIGNVFIDNPPDFILKLQKRICNVLKLSSENSFLQVVDMEQGGEIAAHYDASIEGFINYKCNLSVLSENYYFFVDKEKFLVKDKDLYCFEASLFRHKTDKFKSKRILLSFGFMIPYKDLGRNELDPRIRLSKRIKKYFQYN